MIVKIALDMEMIVMEEGRIKMVRVKFEYADALSNWEWRKQECVVRDVAECIRIYGLGVDCEYRILEVEEV